MTVGMQDDGRTRLAVTAPDENALELLAFKLMADCPVPAHAISLASSASFLTVFMFRAVPASAAGMRIRVRPIPRSP